MRLKNHEFLKLVVGKKTNESSSKIVEAGGGNRIRPNEATEQFEQEKSIMEEE